ncbi:hypothetical protein [Roseovarius sp. MBR-6]|uniref:hypothetical protein n=1 Tax=Roseovarius sp. MBR-6 TaxID=3156459 RepID=UPI0033961499
MTRKLIALVAAAALAATGFSAPAQARDRGETAAIVAGVAALAIVGATLASDRNKNHNRGHVSRGHQRDQGYYAPRHSRGQGYYAPRPPRGNAYGYRSHRNDGYRSHRGNAYRPYYGNRGYGYTGGRYRHDGK